MEQYRVWKGLMDIMNLELQIHRDKHTMEGNDKMNENQQTVYTYLYWEIKHTGIPPMSIIYYMIDNLHEIPIEVYTAYTQLSEKEELLVLYNISEYFLHYELRYEPNE